MTPIIPPFHPPMSNNSKNHPNHVAHADDTNNFTVLGHPHAVRARNLHSVNGVLYGRSRSDLAGSRVEVDKTTGGDEFEDGQVEGRKRVRSQASEVCSGAES